MKNGIPIATVEEKGLPNVPLMQEQIFADMEFLWVVV